MKTCVVVPAFNEAAVIDGVIRHLKRYVADVIVVDDGSRDNTGEIAAQAGATVITHMINRGQGAALQTGILFALAQGSDAIITFDADGQHQPGEIDRVLRPLLIGAADVVLGSRFLNGHNHVPMTRRLLLKSAAWVTAAYTGLPVTDAHNGFRAFSRAAAEQIDLHQDGMAHASEIIEQIKKHQLRFVEVPVTIKYTSYSLRKGQKISNAVRIFWDLLWGRLSQ